MGQEPKRRHSKSRKRRRNAAKMLHAISLVKCPNCQELTLAHQVCKNCGFYNKKVKA